MMQNSNPVVKERTKVKLRSILLVTSFVLSFLCVLAAAYIGLISPTPTSVTDCRTFNTNGSYILSNNVSSSGTCFSIGSGVSDLTFNGNGKTVTVSSGEAVDVIGSGTNDPHHVTIQNLNSNNGIRTYGDAVHHVIIENSTLSGVEIYGSDDITVRNNTIGSGGIHAQDGDYNWPSYRPIFTNNTITGLVGHTTKVLLEVMGGAIHPCPRIDAVITDNKIYNYRNDPPPEATAGMRVRCATYSVVTGNLVRSYGTTIGLYLRDESDDGRYENNTFWTNSEEAIRSASGNIDKTFPARNIIRNNVFRSDAGKATYLQGIGSGNTFSYNVFYSALINDHTNGANGTLFDHNTFYIKNSGSLISFDLRTTPADVYTNNIFSYSGSSIYSYINFSTAQLTSNRNMFQNRAGAVSFGAQGSSLSAWRTNTGDDLQSTEANPQFTDPANGTFTLASASPARGAASDASDLGAIPFGSTPPPPGASSLPPSSCTESWSCGSWGQCSNSLQSRTCTDANSCGTIVNRPALTQSCQSSCTENWSCGAWSTCTNGSQSRSCTDASSCGTTVNRPALVQSCSTTGVLSCGVAACGGCTTNHILATACTTADRQCDGTNTIQDIQLSTATLTGGQTLTADIDYGCYSSNTPEDNIALWYYNGSSWRLIRHWPTPLTGCDTTPDDTDGRVSISFTPDSIVGTHYVRAILGAGNPLTAPAANSSSCPSTMPWGNIDDLAFSVTARACTENWSCGAWSTCTNGSQSRTCTDANSCSTTVNRPALVQSCITAPVSSLPLSCNKEIPSCYNCKNGLTKYNRILAPNGGKLPNGSICGTTASAPLQCDGSNAIENLQLNKSTLAAGEPLTVSIDYACYKDATYNSDDLTLWFFNGLTWKPLKTWYSNNGTLPGCQSTAPSGLGYPKSGTVTFTFTPDLSGTDSYVRAYLDSSSTMSSLTTACPTSLTWGNIDDMKFTVQARQSVIINPSINPL